MDIDHPSRKLLPMAELLALAEDIAAGADIHPEDEIYRRTVLARIASAADITELTKYLDD